MEYVDTHFHVWELSRFPYPWPTADMKIHRDYFPCGIETGSTATPVKHGIFVQCLNGNPDEARWVMDMATRHPFIQGVVAGLDLTSSSLDATIKSLQEEGRGLLKGSRHILDVEVDDWITRDDVSKGLETLAKNNLSYDLLVRPRHLKYIKQVVDRHPSLKFIINHIAKPPFSEGRLDGWKEDMAAIATAPNVFCKISGLISEQTTESWRTLKYEPFINHVVAVFGVDRCMFGSDWPVFDMVDATYEENYKVVQNALNKLSDEDQRKIFRNTAIKVYNLNL